jgi:hypothetical protein|tara:strand:+ start:666 stop:974 length:309 start_codon:yes stop_codon:yes gene_type:complete
MIELEFDNYGSLLYYIENIGTTEIKVHFYDKNYVTNPEDYVIIKSIIYKGLILPELFEYSLMSTDNTEYASLTNVNYVSFNGTWQLKFTEEDIKSILKRKLS